jgi:3-hydroxyisobutyrate dehydrogenase
VAFVDAPVLGSKQPAEQGRLVVLASGPDDVRDRVQPVFDAIGQRTMWLGAAGQASRLKLVANLWVVTVVEGAAETLALAEGLGLDPELLLDAIEGGPLDLPYLRLKAKAILARDFTPSFRLALAAKDADLVAEAAQSHGLQLAMAEAIAAQMHAAADDGHADEDLSATWYATGVEAR